MLIRAAHIGLTYLLLAVAVWHISAGMGRAHDWYDTDCCSGEDCAPITVNPENISVSPDGITVHLPVGSHPLLAEHPSVTRFIPFGHTSIRPSKDMDWHVCVSVRPFLDYKTGIVAHSVYCVYVGGGV